MQALLAKLDFWWQSTAYHVRRPAAMVSLLVLALVGYVAGAIIASLTVNARYDQGDQDGYISYTLNLVKSNFTWVGDRNRMPLYSGLQGLLISQEARALALLDADDEDEVRTLIFARGKVFNIVFSLAGLVILGAVAAGFLAPWPSAIFVGATAMGLYLPKAGYYQSEILYYTLFSVFFIGAAWLVHRPRWWLAIGLGMVAALAHWTKASILPGVVLLVAVLTLRTAWELWFSLKRRQNALPTIAQSLACITLLLVCYIGGIAPYLLNSKRIYGSYLYNVNSTFYIWADSFEEAKLVRKAGDRKGWPKLPPEKTPSAHRYFTEKTPVEIAGRLFGGMLHQVGIARGSYGAWRFALPLAGLCGWLLWRKRAELPRWALAHAWMLLFSALFFGAYFTLISFYTPIADGARFLFALYVPTLAAVLWGIESLSGTELEGAAPTPRTWVYRVVTLFIIIELPVKLLTFMHTTYCGS